jgi:hypothetical protein
MADNALYYGDNLDVLRRHMKHQTLDLICAGPPLESRVAFKKTPKADEPEQLALDE